MIKKTCFCSTVISMAQQNICGKGNSVPVQILILYPVLSFIILFMLRSITMHAL